MALKKKKSVQYIFHSIFVVHLKNSSEFFGWSKNLIGLFKVRNVM